VRDAYRFLLSPSDLASPVAVEVSGDLEHRRFYFAVDHAIHLHLKHRNAKILHVYCVDAAAGMSSDDRKKSMRRK
jgi:hypothetical protein